jgi:hypothetical protein
MINEPVAFWRGLFVYGIQEDKDLSIKRKINQQAAIYPVTCSRYTKFAKGRKNE